MTMRNHQLDVHFATTHRPGRALNAHTDGARFFSYETEVARKISADERVAWVTTLRYSQTTSAHVNGVAQALKMAGWRVIRAVKLSDICTDCWRTAEEHAGGKHCLFDHTTFRAAA